MGKNDAYSIIMRELSSSPKTSKELREACERAGIPDSKYFYHLRQIVQKLREAEEISISDDKGRLISKYALVEQRDEATVEEARWLCHPDGFETLEVGDLQVDFPPSRMLLELAAWIREDPSNWDANDINVRKARLCLECGSSLVPQVGKTREDPDKYAFIWSDDAVKELGLEGTVSSRFFDLRAVYDAAKGDLGRNTQIGGAVFLGAYSSPLALHYVNYDASMHSLRRFGKSKTEVAVEGPQSVGVAVSKENDVFRVVHVETREGELDKVWVSGIAKHLKAKKTCGLNSDSLKENDRREILLKLRGLLDKRKLVIPERYAALIENLLQYEYKKSPNAHVLGLALAVNLSTLR